MKVNDRIPRYPIMHTRFFLSLNGLGIGPGIGLGNASGRPCPAAGSTEAASVIHGTQPPCPAV